jgi:hypothetical protein
MHCMCQHAWTRNCKALHEHQHNAISTKEAHARARAALTWASLMHANASLTSTGSYGEGQKSKGLTVNLKVDNAGLSAAKRNASRPMSLATSRNVSGNSRPVTRSGTTQRRALPAGGDEGQAESPSKSYRCAYTVSQPCQPQKPANIRWEGVHMGHMSQHLCLAPAALLFLRSIDPWRQHCLQSSCSALGAPSLPTQRQQWQNQFHLLSLQGSPAPG